MTHEEAKAAKKQLNLEKEKFSDFCKATIDEFENRKAQLQRDCPHEEVCPYPGSSYAPSGGYDCNLCELDLGNNKPPNSKVF
jgi:hypothetical protein